MRMSYSQISNIDFKNIDVLRIVDRQQYLLLPSLYLIDITFKKLMF